MIGNIIQEKFLVEINYPEAAALSVILMIAMLILASIYARILGTEDATLRGGERMSAVATTAARARARARPAPRPPAEEAVDPVHPAPSTRRR